MQIGKQIKKFRAENGLSQERLAERVYVSRQTISNWENDKNYPDVKSLLLLSSIFDVSLDILIKGDIEEMKNKINDGEVKKFEQDSTIFTILLLSCIVLPIPLVSFLGKPGLWIYVLIGILALYYGMRVEKYKKNFDIQTYKEIVAFSEGKGLSMAEKNQEIGKRKYQHFMLAIGSGVVTLIIAVIMAKLLGK